MLRKPETPEAPKAIRSSSSAGVGLAGGVLWRAAPSRIDTHRATHRSPFFPASTTPTPSHTAHLKPLTPSSGHTHPHQHPGRTQTCPLGVPRNSHSHQAHLSDTPLSTPPPGPSPTLASRGHYVGGLCGSFDGHLLNILEPSFSSQVMVLHLFPPSIFLRGDMDPSLEKYALTSVGCHRPKDPGKLCPAS